MAVAGLALLVGVAAFGPVAGAATIYVRTTGADANDGLSWGSAKATVGGGLAAAVSGDQVWVAAGTYVEQITLKAGVGLYGGFAGNEMQLEQRDWVSNPTILDGNQSGAVVTSPSGAALDTRIDGFTICNGNVSGVMCGSSSPTIANNRITRNSSRTGQGGGIACFDSSAVIVDNTIAENTSSALGVPSYGGGIYAGGTASSPVISDNTIAGNVVICGSSLTLSVYGGGIYCTSGLATITNNRIIGNAAVGGIANGTGNGGGIYCYSCSASIANNIIAGNTASGAGGSSGGGLFCKSCPSLTFSNNTEVENNATSGGGLYCDSSSASISNNIIAFNCSGIYRSGSSGTLSLRNNCLWNPDGENYAGLSPGTGDISADPALLAEEYGEVHLTAGSPCVDLGEDTVVQAGWVDIDGEARIQGAHVDIGADEFNGSTPPFAPRTVRVSPLGNDANDGSSWALAKRTVQAGIAATADGGEVWVAAGVYNESITLGPWTRLYGGFAGDESSREERNWVTNESILDAGGNGSVVLAMAGYRGGRVDGLTIRNGNDTSVRGYRGGGGIRCLSSLTIVNNKITGSTAVLGGGIFCLRSKAVISNNTIVDNPAAGIYCGACSPSILSNRIVGNSWGIGCDLIASPTIANNAITGNGSGGIGCTHSSATIVNNTIVGNGASSSGGIYCDSSSPTVSNNILAFNSNGVYVASGTPVLRNNCVYNPSGGDYHGIGAGTGDIAADPRLEGSGYGQVHLMAGSPCIDAGLDSDVQSGWVDMDGESRIQGAHVDIGADEYNGTPPPAFTPTVVRVSPWGDDGQDGSSWAAAKRTVQAGIDAACSAGGEVWVAGGIYVERITLKPWAYVYGGFAGTESSRDQRNWAVHAAVLDGAAGGSVVKATTGYRASRLDGFTVCNGGGADRGGGIYCDSASPTISNNTIMGNSATRLGGGIYCLDSSAIITDNVIRGNTAYQGSGQGGGIYCSISTVVISNNTITGNTARDGGGLYCPGGSPVISNNIVAFNSSGICAAAGGAPNLQSNCVYNPGGADYSGLNPGSGDVTADPLLVAAEYGDVHLRAGSPCIDAGLDSVVQPDWADMDCQTRTQGAHVDMGADEFDGTEPPYAPTIIRVSPSGDDANDGSSWGLAKRTVQAGIDAASSMGGEVWVEAGLYNERINLKPWSYLYGGFAGTEDTREQRNWVSHQSILDGGSGGSVVSALSGYRVSRIDGFTIRNGSAPAGSGIYCACSAVIANNRITDNGMSGSGYGGAVCCDSSMAEVFDNTIAGNGTDGICCTSSRGIISNNTITGNNGRGISCLSSSPAIWNNIVAFNLSGLYSSSGGAPTLQSNCVYNPAGAGYSGLNPGTGDISADPLLVAADYGELHLAAESPCIDAGNDGAVQSDWTDLDGEPRIQGARVDIGADEFNGTAPPPFVPTVVRVSPFGDDAYDGSSWALPKRTVRSAIEAASSVGGEVWVAGGVYTERIILKAWAHVYGGFAGVENTRDEREWAGHVTTLDGAGGGSVVSVLSGYRVSRIDGFAIHNGAGTVAGLYCYGGGIYCAQASPMIANCWIVGNTAKDTDDVAFHAYGGGICCLKSSPMIVNSVIAGNNAESGGGVYANSGNPTILDCTFSGNTASYGAGLSGSMSVTNCIFWSASGVPVQGFSGNPVLTHCDVQGGYAGTGNIDSDPRFVRDPSPGGDGMWGTADDDYRDVRLQAGSPCIDAGSNEAAVAAGLLTDLDGFARFVDDPATDDCTFAPGTCGTAPIVDMGAYEFIPGDYDRDGDVDLDDLAGLEACWSGAAVAYTGDCARADFDRDGDVDMDDFGVFQRCFGERAGR